MQAINAPGWVRIDLTMSFYLISIVPGAIIDILRGRTYGYCSPTYTEKYVHYYMEDPLIARLISTDRIINGRYVCKCINSNIYIIRGDYLRSVELSKMQIRCNFSEGAC